MYRTKSGLRYTLRFRLAPVLRTLGAVGTLLLCSAQARAFGESEVTKHIPASFLQRYPFPVLAQDDITFAPDTSGISLIANILSSDSGCMVVVVNPRLKGDSAVVWHSRDIAGRPQYIFRGDINQDGFDELVLATHRPGANGWHRLQIWRWNGAPTEGIPTRDPSQTEATSKSDTTHAAGATVATGAAGSAGDWATQLFVCGDTARAFFEARTLIETQDMNADGVMEIVAREVLTGGVTRQSPAGRMSDVYVWNGVAYCISR